MPAPEAAAGAKAADAAAGNAAGAGAKKAAEGASGPKTYRTVNEGQELMAVKVVRSAGMFCGSLHRREEGLEGRSLAVHWRGRGGDGRDDHP